MCSCISLDSARLDFDSHPLPPIARPLSTHPLTRPCPPAQDLICQLLNLVKRHCVLHDAPFPFPWVVPTITDADFEPANKRRLERLVEAQTYAAHFVNFASDEVRLNFVVPMIFISGGVHT